jgi:hypothetical protein
VILASFVCEDGSRSRPPSRPPRTVAPWLATADRGGARVGSYPGMPATRTFNVVFVGANHGAGLGITATPDHVVTYDGSATTVTAP